MFLYNVFLPTANFPSPSLIYGTCVLWAALHLLHSLRGEKPEPVPPRRPVPAPFHLCVGKDLAGRLAAISPFAGRWCSRPGSEPSRKPARSRLLRAPGPAAAASPAAELGPDGSWGFLLLRAPHATQQLKEQEAQGGVKCLQKNSWKRQDGKGKQKLWR